MRRLLRRFLCTDLDEKLHKRLTPKDWEGFQVGDVVDVRQATYISYCGPARITALTAHYGRPVVHIKVEGVERGIVDIDRLSLAYRNHLSVL